MGPGRGYAPLDTPDSLCLFLKDELAILDLQDPDKQFLKVMVFIRSKNGLTDCERIVRRQLVSAIFRLKKEPAGGERPFFPFQIGFSVCYEQMSARPALSFGKHPNGDDFVLLNL